ncbi:MAG: hypothetical protein HUU50_04810 [Candidatus Brocadiae bacterium]|nr:hypothetical protein [Candidatus Brocadiia bacterium]
MPPIRSVDNVVGDVPISFLLKRIFSRVLNYFVIIFLLALFVFLSQGIILVREGEMAILIKKTGEDLTNYNVEKGQYNYLLSCPAIAPNNDYKGIQHDPLSEGWHFYNPYIWDFEIHHQTIISKGEVGVKVRLYGKPLRHQEYQNLAEEGQMGILKEVLMPGQHLVNPYAYKVIKSPAINIAQGFRGIVTQLAGKNTNRKIFVCGDILDPKSLAIRLKEQKDALSKFIYSTFSASLKKKLETELEQMPIKELRVSFVVVLNQLLSSASLYTQERFANIKLSIDTDTLLKRKPQAQEEIIQLNRWLLADAYPNWLERSSFLVAENERGVCEEVLLPGTYYFNPYEKSVDIVDIRSHRFDLSDQNQAVFPSFDGFPINMEGNIEWLINPERVAEVFVKYRDNRDIILSIVEKIILPNARALVRLEGSKYMARDFISGQTREKFQNSFFQGISRSCEKEGIIIKAARVTKCTPPDKICNPIQQKEIAIREKEKYIQEIEREKQQITLKMEAERKDLEVRKIKAITEVEVTKTNALREKEVAIIELIQHLEVAKKRLEAAKNEAEAIVVEAQAKADVIRMQNKAHASGIEDARMAFKTGKSYSNYLLLQKVSSSLEYILGNSDSPFLNVFKGIGTNLDEAKNPQSQNQEEAKNDSLKKGEK